MKVKQMGGEIAAAQAAVAAEKEEAMAVGKRSVRQFTVLPLAVF
jgi:hypothetical protein